MKEGNLILKPASLPLTQTFRAEPVNDELFLAVPLEGRGLICVIDKYGPLADPDTRGFRIHRIHASQKTAFVRPCAVPDEFWFVAFPLEQALTPEGIAQAALKNLPLPVLLSVVSEYAIEQILDAKGSIRGNAKVALSASLKIAEAFKLLEAAVDEASTADTDNTGILTLKAKLAGWYSECLQKFHMTK